MVKGLSVNFKNSFRVGDLHVVESAVYYYYMVVLHKAGRTKPRKREKKTSKVTMYTKETKKRIGQ